MRTYYFAYGANTNCDGMARRCPGAKPVGSLIVTGRRLVFRGVADVVRDKGAEVFGALWTLAPGNEKALDRFEGYPTLYVKEYFEARFRKKQCRIMMYVMRDQGGQSQPSEYYWKLLCDGYRHFRLPHLQLADARQRAQRAERRRFEKAWADIVKPEAKQNHWTHYFKKIGKGGSPACVRCGCAMDTRAAYKHCEGQLRLIEGRA